jgi:hypothetical protein
MSTDFTSSDQEKYCLAGAKQISPVGLQSGTLHKNINLYLVE